MRRWLALTVMVGALLSLMGCGTTTPKVHTRYTAHGRYYVDGTVITSDGNAWAYAATVISDKTPFDGMPIYVAFDDNATPNDIYDDVVLGVVFDVNTHIYDRLETALSDKFVIERDGNNITIQEVINND